LNQKSKAYDASAKELARTAETTAETYSTDHEGTYTGMNLAELKKYETGLLGCPSTSNACLNAVTATANTYTVETEAANSKDKFKITRNASGEIERECTSTGTGCAGTTKSSW
jgi:hypothetical protein